MNIIVKSVTKNYNILYLYYIRYKIFKINKVDDIVKIFRLIDWVFFKKSINKKIKNKKTKKSENSIMLKRKKPGGDIKDIETREPNKNKFTFSFKWAWQDSNLRPTDYESVALTN